jgi:hypothetical protein
VCNGLEPPFFHIFFFLCRTLTQGYCFLLSPSQTKGIFQPETNTQLNVKIVEQLLLIT